MAEEEVEFSDYDLLDEDYKLKPVPAADALAYPETDTQDDAPEAKVLGLTLEAPRKPDEAIAIAREWSHERRFVGVGRCLATVRQYYGVGSRYGTAASAWTHAQHKHYVSDGRNIPRGAPVYWTGGSRGAGHIAISIGGGWCWSTDWKQPGRIDLALINDITRQWGLHLVGYANEINDVVVWVPFRPIGTVALHNLHPGAKNKDVLQLKKRLYAKGYRGFLKNSKKFGGGIRAAYARYQKKLGYSGADANGIPGRTSLRKLGFRVID